MPRTRPVADSTALHRRSLLAVTGAVALSAGAGYALRSGGGQAVAADAGADGTVLTSSRQAPAAPLAPYTRGTTVAGMSVPRGGRAAGYRRLDEGPGWERVVRGELAGARSGREDRRTTLAAFVQLTDLHVIDAQHPLRLEYLRSADVHAWRPHEALTVHGAVSSSSGSTPCAAPPSPAPRCTSR